MICSDLLLPLTRDRRHPRCRLPRRLTLDPSIEGNLKQSHLCPVRDVKSEQEMDLCCSETPRVRGHLLQQQIHAFPD